MGWWLKGFDVKGNWDSRTEVYKNRRGAGSKKLGENTIEVIVSIASVENIGVMTGF